MININKLISSDEKEIYRLAKRKRPLIFIIISCPLFVFLSSALLVLCFRNLFLGAISFDSYGIYLVSIFCLIFFVPLGILQPISFALNQLIITDKRIFIRKGLVGKLIIINFRDISAFQHIYISTRGGDIEKMYFYLNSGKKIRTGDLYVKKESLNTLLEILSYRIKTKIITKKQVKELKKSSDLSSEMITIQNPIFPTITVIPFLIALLMFSLYITGFNEKGLQHNIVIIGTIEEKYPEFDRNYKEITGYKIVVNDNKTNKKYKIAIDEVGYRWFNESDKIAIKAKKGSLGLVYDEQLYKLGISCKENKE